jgi:hypothetical protein
MRRSLSVLAVWAILGLAPALAHAELPAPLDDAELAGQRGGFVTAAGLTFDFAAQLTTFVDGQLALESRLNLQTGGFETSQSLVQLDGAEIVHRFDGQSLANILINSASDRSFRQDLDLTLTLPGFAAVQQRYDVIRLGADLAEQIGVMRNLR